MVNLQDSHGVQGGGCLARRRPREQVHRDCSLHLGNARVHPGSPAIEGSEDGGDGRAASGRERGHPRLRQLLMHLREKKALEQNAVVSRALLRETNHPAARALLTSSPILTAKIRDDWGFQVNRLCYHVIPRSDRQIGNYKIPSMRFCMCCNLKTAPNIGELSLVSVIGPLLEWNIPVLPMARRSRAPQTSGPYALFHTSPPPPPH